MPRDPLAAQRPRNEACAVDSSTTQFIGTAVSVVAVTLSLLGLAFQVRQQTRTLRAQNYAQALDRLAAVQARLSESERLAGIFARGAMDTRLLTIEERIQFTWTFYEIFGAIEFMYDQMRAGALPSHVWERWERTLSWWIAQPGVASWWRGRPTPFNDRFTALVESRMADPRIDMERLARWDEFLENPHSLRPRTGEQAGG